MIGILMYSALEGLIITLSFERLPVQMFLYSREGMQVLLAVEVVYLCKVAALYIVVLNLNFSEKIRHFM